LIIRESKTYTNQYCYSKPQVVLMDTLIEIFGKGKDLTTLQMSCRGIVVFIIALILIRISGRRSFGVRTPLDNIVLILLGAVLSRAVVGASAFVPVITVCFIIVILHRIFGWAVAHNKRFARLTEGDKILLFENGRFIESNVHKALVCQEDIMQGIRESALTEDLTKIDKVYMERNGQISAIKKA
jgi:uncharacterized membrane protein YcaP (DUF421 family)